MVKIIKKTSIFEQTFIRIDLKSQMRNSNTDKNLL